MTDEQRKRLGRAVILGIIGLLLSIAMILFMVLTIDGPARAEYAQAYRSRPVDRLDGFFHGEVRHRRARKVWRHHTPHEPKCRPPLAVVGDQYATEKGAQDEADKAWMQTARWQWGERYMAREHADEATYECGRSSVGSLAGQVFIRCRLTAMPCRPGPQDGDK